MMRKRHILLMNTTRCIDRLNGSSTHFLTKQLFSVSFCHRPSSNHTIQSWLCRNSPGQLPSAVKQSISRLANWSQLSRHLARTQIGRYYTKTAVKSLTSQRSSSRMKMYDSSGRLYDRSVSSVVIRSFVTLYRRGYLKLGFQSLYRRNMCTGHENNHERPYEELDLLLIFDPVFEKRGHIIEIPLPVFVDV
jgi:hypothetical protein